MEESHPEKLLLFGYLFYTTIGWIFLLLPAAQKVPIPSLDNFFTAISAISTTGLTTVDTGTSYTFFGQLVILILIQMGGIGYATFASFVVLSTTKQLSKLRTKVSVHSFSLPSGFVIHEFINHVILYTLICETIGAISLSFFFYSHNVKDAIWEAIFHSISAFCTAGFSLFSTSFEIYRDDFWVNLILSVLSILGAMGFIVWIDLYKRIIGQKSQTTFTTRIIVSVTFWFLLIGTFLFFQSTTFQENLPLYEKIMIAFFQTMTASTTVGFNTMNIGTLSYAAITLLLFLMAFGASPSGTGGGLKSTTFSALLGLVKSTLRGKNEVTFWNHAIPQRRLLLATSSLAYYMFVMATSIYILTLVEDKPFLPLFFEASSALSTIGLSMGITSQLTDVGKIMIILLMLMGRVGILTFGVAISISNKAKIKPHEENDLVF